MRRTMAVIGAAVFATAGAVSLLVGLPATPAAAHAELVSSEPASGEVLDSAPARVALHFTEGVQIDGDAVQVFDGAGDGLDVGRPTTSDGGATVTADLPDLGDGAYVVTWRITSEDSHPIHGAFTFRVGAAGSGDDAEALMARLESEDRGDTVVGTAYGVVRFVAFAGAVLLVGGAAFVLVLWPAGRDDRRARQLVGAGWWAFTVATVLSIGLQGAYAAAEGLGGALEPSLIGDVLGTRAGRVWVVRLVVLALVALAGWRLLPRRARAAGTRRAATSVGAAANAGDPGAAGAPTGRAADEPDRGGVLTAEPGDRRAGAAPGPSPALAVRFPILTTGRRDPARLALLVVLAVVLLTTISLAGHASTGRWVPVAMVVDVLHLAAVSLWLGGLALLLLVVLRRSPDGPPADAGTIDASTAVTDADNTDAERVVRGFSTLAFAAVVVLVVTGVIQGWRQTGSVDALDTTYGRLLIAKVVLVALMLVAAFFSRRWAQGRPAAARATAAGEPDASGPAALAGPDGGLTVRDLRRSVGVEVLVAIAVLGVTAILVNTVPGQDELVTGFSEEVHGAEVLVRVEVDPAEAGRSDVQITTLDHTGAVLEPEEVAASLTLTERAIGPMPLTLEPAGPGRFRAAQADIPFPGTWTLEVDVRLSEFDQDTVTAEIPIG